MNATPVQCSGEQCLTSLSSVVSLLSLSPTDCSVGQTENWELSWLPPAILDLPTINLYFYFWPGGASSHWLSGTLTWSTRLPLVKILTHENDLTHEKIIKILFSWVKLWNQDKPEVSFDCNWSSVMSCHLLASSSIFLLNCKLKMIRKLTTIPTW